MDPSSQQPILQDPFNQSRVDHCVKAVRDSTVEKQQLLTRKRYLRNSDGNHSVPHASTADRGFTQGDASSSRSKLRKISNCSTVSSRLHPQDSGDHAWYPQKECLRYPREISDNIPHMSEVPPDAVFPTPDYAKSCWSNGGSSDGSTADDWDPKAMAHRDPPPPMYGVSPEDTRSRLQI
ncbi:hypothetical protein MMC18_005447 [Xylographa bjoerkii]|nr:hypothetical protein [Xylographa bjoerkii]